MFQVSRLVDHFQVEALVEDILDQEEGTLLEVEVMIMTPQMRVCQKTHPLFYFSSSVIFAVYCQAAIFPLHMTNCSIFCLRQVKIRLFMR